MADFKQTFDLAAVGIAHVALDGTFLDVNPHLCDLVGYSREELIQLTFTDITHPDDIGPDWEQAIALAKGTINSYSMDKRYFHKDGQVIWIKLTGSLCRDAEGGPNYYIAIIQDITARKTAEAASRAKSEFLSAMSHELRTPLNGIFVMTQLLHDGDFGDVSETQKSCLADVLTSAEHLLQLINDLLDLARVEAGKREVISEWVEPNALIRQVLSGVSGLIIKGHLTVTVSTDPSIKHLYVDPMLFRQILLNFVSNAVKFTPMDGKIEVELRRDRDGFVLLQVSDSGPGISKQDAERLFVPFEQLGDGTSRLKGTGLGLALVKRFAGLLNGYVGVESELGRGSRFFFRLPSHDHSADKN